MNTLLDLPLAASGVLITAVFLGFALAGLLLTRRFVLPSMNIGPEDSEFTGAMVQGVLVFYGLALALIAVSVFESYGDAETRVSEEATCLAMLYRDSGAYPEPARSQLRGHLRDYTRYIIDQAWPLQRKSIVPQGGILLMDRFQAALLSFQPATEAEKLYHGETLRAYNLLIHARRARLDAVTSSLPLLMWFVIVVGGAIALVSTFFFAVPSLRLHACMVSLIAVFIAVVVFMVFALDHPFHGDLGISPQSYELVYDQLMK